MHLTAPPPERKDATSPATRAAAVQAAAEALAPFLAPRHSIRDLLTDVSSVLLGRLIEIRRAEQGLGETMREWHGKGGGK